MTSDKSPSDICAERLAQKMLQGSVLTSELCNTCSGILVRTKSVLECVMCQPTLASVNDDNESIASFHSAPDNTDKLRKAEVSKQLGQHLMVGWTMLNETCPKCPSIPLMKLQKETRCVGCDYDSKNAVIQEVEPVAEFMKQAPAPPLAEHIPATLRTKQAQQVSFDLKSSILDCLTVVNSSLSKHDIESMERDANAISALVAAYKQIDAM